MVPCDPGPLIGLHLADLGADALHAALGDGWLPSSRRGFGVGCGLGVEAGHLATAGTGGHSVDETLFARRATLPERRTLGGITTRSPLHALLP